MSRVIPSGRRPYVCRCFDARRRSPESQSLTTQGSGHNGQSLFLVRPCIDITGAGY